MSALLFVLGCALGVFLLTRPGVGPGVKVLVLTAPPVAVVVWLLVEVFDEPSAALAVAAVFVVVLVALNGVVGHPRLSVWAKTTVFGTVPVAALAWLLVVTADDTLKDPGEDPCSMRYGGVGVSEAFPPQAYCLYRDGSTYNLASGAQFVFWVCFAVSLALLSTGLWQVAREPGTLVRQFRAGTRPPAR
ncbi:hypothetical protein [Streptomyces sp. NPDC098781]|uniref:hypothetical protein n=1 Tax=Streptomyces sp. NPDC098781 TaxID=3366097 RepID=UPI00382C4370